MATIVSGFIDIDTAKDNRNIDAYFKWGKLLLSTNVPKIIFLEQKSIDVLGESYIKSISNTTFIPFEKKRLILYDLIKDKDNLKLPNPPPHETTPSLEYLSIIINKTEWMKKAVEINTYKTEQFIWIDFGIYHIFNTPVIFKKYVLNTQTKIYDKVRIGSIWDLTYSVSKHQIKNIPLWFFAGGVFGGNKYKLVIFANKVKEKIEELIKEGYIMWEVNIWYLVYKENKELFDSYKCDHNLNLLKNY